MSQIENSGGKTVTRRTVRKVRPSGQWLKIIEREMNEIDRISEQLGADVAPSRIREMLDELRSQDLAVCTGERDQPAADEWPATTGEAGEERRGAYSEIGLEV